LEVKCYASQCISVPGGQNNSLHKFKSAVFLAPAYCEYQINQDLLSSESWWSVGMITCVSLLAFVNYAFSGTV
jgi:hypothetical protein